MKTPWRPIAEAPVGHVILVATWRKDQFDITEARQLEKNEFFECQYPNDRVDGAYAWMEIPLVPDPPLPSSEFPILPSKPCEPTPEIDFFDEDIPF